MLISECEIQDNICLKTTNKGIYRKFKKNNLSWMIEPIKVKTKNILINVL